jgi:UPF0755 protein
MSVVRRTGRVLKTILASILLLIIIVTAVSLTWYTTVLRPVTEACPDDHSTPCEQQFTITANESVGTIADRLEQAQLIRSGLAFQIYAHFNGRAQYLQAGTYTLRQDYSLGAILDRLANGDIDSNTFRITFLPGETLTETRQHLRDAGYNDTDIDAGFNYDYDHPIFAGAPAAASLEGYIYGDTYEFYKSTPVHEIITRVLDEFWEAIQADQLPAQLQTRGFSLYQGLTLASIVQKESSTPGTISEMPTVAQIFELRLARQIPLGSDAVVAYRANQLNPNRDKSDMSYLSTVSCPWNSRKCTGLPPNPISTPGLSALKAVAQPANTDYLYFLTGDDDRMYYAHTEAEHEANKRFCPNLCGYL